MMLNPVTIPTAHAMEIADMMEDMRYWEPVYPLPIDRDGDDLEHAEMTARALWEGK